MQATDVQTLHGLRKKNLDHVRIHTFRGNMAELARALGKNGNQIRLVLTGNSKISRNIGETAAREYERALGLPAFWLDQRHGDSLPVPARSTATQDSVRATAEQSVADLPALHRAVVVKFIDLSRAGAIDERFAHQIMGQLLGLA